MSIETAVSSDTSALIRVLVDQLAEKYPGAHLSFGYIGSVWGAPYRDDRSWRVFTRLPWGAWGGYPTDCLPDMLGQIEAGRLEEWLVAALASGRVA